VAKNKVLPICSRQEKTVTTPAGCKSAAR